MVQLTSSEESGIRFQKRDAIVLSQRCTSAATRHAEVPYYFQRVEEDGSPMGVDPFNYVTIAGVAFNGIYCTHFLPPQTIITVPRPSKANHSFKQIIWLEYKASKPNDPSFSMHVMLENMK